MAERPTDEQILAYENAIREEAGAYPLVGPLLPIDAGLVDEYADGTSPAFAAKAAEVARQYACVRHMRRDGNCFYRAFAFGLVSAARGWYGRGARADTGCVAKAALERRLADSPFQKEVYEEFADELVGPFADATLGGPDELAARWADDEYRAQAAIVPLRLAASAEIRAHAAEYAPFLPTPDVGAFCAAHVEAMGVESEEVHATALCGALGVRVRIAYMDPSPGPLSVIDIGPSDAAVTLHMLYRPGHYDLLYEPS